MQLNNVKVAGPHAGLLVGGLRRALDRPGLAGPAVPPADQGAGPYPDPCPQAPGHLGRADDKRRRPIADRRAHEQGERRRDLAAGKHVVDGDLGAVLRVGVQRRVPMALDRDLREILPGGTAALHVGT